MSLNMRRTIADNDIHSLTVAAQAGAMAVDGEVVIDLAKRSVDVMMNTAGGKQLLCIFTYYSPCIVRVYPCGLQLNRSIIYVHLFTPSKHMTAIDCS